MEGLGAYPTLRECEKIILEQMLSLGDSVEMFSLFYVSCLFIRRLRFYLGVDKAVRKCVGSCPILCFIVRYQGPHQRGCRRGV